MYGCCYMESNEKAAWKLQQWRAFQILDFFFIKLTKHIKAGKAFKLNFNGLNMCSKDERDFFFFHIYIFFLHFREKAKTS